MSAILDLSDLRKPPAGVHALDGVRSPSRAGSITGLIGPNGSGKSTAIDCISRLPAARRRQVALAGTDITGLPAHHIARAGLMRTFQTVRIYDRLPTCATISPSPPSSSIRRPGSTSSSAPAATATAVEASETRARALVELIGLAELLRERGRHPVLRPEEAGGACRGPDAASASIVVLDEPVAGVIPTASARSRRRCASSTGPARPS